ncbi:alpha-aspartyl dipeptidase [Ferrimonas balearica DSM 9799]|uniref:Alpha-aspartyl dipeptidase n=1 Tax=Ferrimonas balearica (strain DSM 9799 / CCM 4581 / KCTC 23876 / PAT) TaxID=550540 RepID=E1SMP3_FERBD|nr:dipeptidase PepE [Ferrimonas balearica]ADN75582.1 alpha-aspartyl dipeptidase [Ferrimonas balearica DSM 9799]
MSLSLLLLSSSKADDTPYLSHALNWMADLVEPGSRWLFIPYAGVSISYDDYHAKVVDALAELDFTLDSAHQLSDPASALGEYDGVMVGGGNTFHLLHELYHHNLVEVLREQVANGLHYIGWSAGSNVAGDSIRTTNDMPIIQPPSFTALQLVPFQLNPHYIDYHPPGHHGETREQRLLEFTCVDPLMPVVGIQEGTALKRQGNALVLMGDKTGYLFQGSTQKQALPPGADLSRLL